MDKNGPVSGSTIGYDVRKLILVYLLARAVGRSEQGVRLISPTSCAEVFDKIYVRWDYWVAPILSPTMWPSFS
ncbi:hypothetical protein F511_24194 [Dorcoceras hygrometricum]|uniref:Uncharacterized protein n=1 Tax=Dorcoceras hygrometricum TaxID=472368 RepID=A0A2Z7CFF0_9LAMI|nr:hypothetical protein F511_24194 [Dorcoceras hygrometricum]